MNMLAEKTESPLATNGHAHSNGANHSSSTHDAQGKRIEEMIAQIESLPDVPARVLMHECLQSVLALYGDGLARILQLIKNTGAEGEKIRDALANDKFVRGLLFIHGLHPVDMETRLQGALAKIRPYLQSHGGNVELISLENDVARLRLQGACKSCPSSTITLELAVRHAVEEACPDLLGFEVEGFTPPTEPATSLTCDEKIFSK